MVCLTPLLSSGFFTFVRELRCFAKRTGISETLLRVLQLWDDFSIRGRGFPVSAFLEVEFGKGGNGVRIL